MWETQQRNGPLQVQARIIFATAREWRDGVVRMETDGTYMAGATPARPIRSEGHGERRATCSERCRQRTYAVQDTRRRLNRWSERTWVASGSCCSRDGITHPSRPTNAELTLCNTTCTCPSLALPPERGRTTQHADKHTGAMLCTEEKKKFLFVHGNGFTRTKSP